MESNANVSQNLVDVIEALILFSIAANALRRVKIPWLQRRPTSSDKEPPPPLAGMTIEGTKPAEVGDTA
jgi:hypothetical protein